MKQGGLLCKTRIKLLVSIILSLQIIGYYLFIHSLTIYAAQNPTPFISIVSPKNGEFLNRNSLVVSGSIENFEQDVSISLFSDNEEIGRITEVNSTSWYIKLPFLEGNHHLYAEALDSAGNTAKSELVTFELDLTPPEVTVIQPINGAVVNSPIFIGKTDPNTEIQICIDCRIENDGQVVGNWLSTLSNKSGVWSYNLPLADGNYTVFAKAVDEAKNQGSIQSIDFILDQTRPIILPEEVFPKHNMTQVPITTSVKIIIYDTNELNEQAITNSITVSLNGTNVPGKTVYHSATKELTFVPKDLLSPNKKYHVFINPINIIDKAGNHAFPKFWSFMTKSVPSDLHVNPHGSYGNNVNTCANCHTTHVSNNPNLLDQKKTDDSPIEEIFSVDNYCMACHDGTVVPMPGNIEKTHTHDAAVNIDGLPNGSSCASCHNPHIEWSEENTNLTQDHIVYKHLPTDPSNSIAEKPLEEISSKEQLCESCHETDIGEKLSNTDVEYRLFEYKKWYNANGLFEDFELCLRCHNSKIKDIRTNIPNIAVYYNNLTTETKNQFENANLIAFTDREISNEEKKFSSHIIKAKDGSPLAGHIPCAECHDTHGSNNIKQLREQLGHENQQVLSIPDGDWNAEKERTFCLKCHNGLTSIYGVTANALQPVSSSGHLEYSTDSCASCHGGSSRSFIESAHAPKKPANSP